MKVLMIDDEPEMKAYDKNLDLSNMTVAKDVEQGIQVLESNPRFDKLYLDGQLPDGSYKHILLWLSDHLDKVPEEIFSISFGTSRNFYPMVQALQATAKRYDGNK